MTTRQRRLVLSARVGLVPALTLALAAWAWAGDPPSQALRVAHPDTPGLAPDFRLATPDGRTIALGDLRGRLVFLNFWATWCPPCRVEMPSMERLHREFKDQGLVVLAVDLQESPRQVARFMRDFRLTFPALLDAEAEVAARYGVRGIPTTFLIDRQGRIVGSAVGPRDWAGAEARQLIRTLLEGKEGDERSNTGRRPPPAERR